MKNQTHASILNIESGINCSVVISEGKSFVRRNGVVKNEIAHKPGCWCIELSHSPYFVSADSKYYEILEPMSSYESIINAFDEVGVQ